LHQPTWNALLVFIFFFVVGRTIIVMAGLARLAGGQRLRLQPGLVLLERDIVELGGLGLRRLAQLLEIVVLLPDGRQGIGLLARLGPAALGKPVQQIGAAVLDGLGVGNDGIVPIDSSLLDLVIDRLERA